MKTLIWFAFLINFIIPSTNHDIPIAIFKLYEKEEDLNLSIVMDIEDFTISTGLHSSNIADETVLNYLNENSAWFFDDRIATIDLISVNREKDHFKIEAKLYVPIRDFSKIKIKNSCLNDVSNHSNIIQIELGEDIKDFRMHKGRTIIEVEL